VSRGDADGDGGAVDPLLAFMLVRLLALLPKPGVRGGFLGVTGRCLWFRAAIRSRSMDAVGCAGRAAAAEEAA
jgi:hypothetical protein